MIVFMTFIANRSGTFAAQTTPGVVERIPRTGRGKLRPLGQSIGAGLADGRWNETDLGSLLSGVFRGEGVSVARGICVRLGEGDGSLSVCFDAETFGYPKVGLVALFVSRKCVMGSCRD